MHLNTLLLLSDGWTQALQLIAALSLLIIIHEGGHFFFARLFKTRVEKFYLFFDFFFPFSGLLNFSLFKKKVGDTEYGIGWFPLGGYVKIAGMVDESMDKEQLAKAPEPWEYRSKKPWQRLLIMLGGIIFNIITAIILYIMVFAVWGERYIPIENLKYGIAVGSVGKEMGLQDGDQIVSLEGKPVRDLKEMRLGILLENKRHIVVKRNGELVKVTVPEEGIIRKIVKAKGETFDARMVARVDSVEKGSLAEGMGLKKGDQLLTINGKPAYYMNEVQHRRKENAGKEIQVVILRGTDTVRAGGVLKYGKDTSELPRIGFVPDVKQLDFKQIDYSIGAAIPRGISYTGEQLHFYWLQLKFLFTSKEVKVAENVGGLGTFAQLFSPDFSWVDFWGLTAFVSLILAIMNLLPIPGLDGGYVIFLMWELITGRKVSDKVMERATSVGLILLVALMLYANGMDILRGCGK